MALDHTQKRTFLPYLRGIPSRALRLGSLYMNPLDPMDTLASLSFRFMGTEKNQSVYEAAVGKWTWDELGDIDRPFAMEFEATKARSLGIGFTDFLSGNKTTSDRTLVKIQGESGRRMQIEDPEAFLKEVMKQPGAHEWICRHASVEHKALFGGGGDKWKAPKIWMVTGIQYITGGDIHSTGSASSKTTGTAGVDLSLALNTPPGSAKAKVEGGQERSKEATTDYKHEQERVWAAQFYPVNIEYGLEEDGVIPAKGKPKTIATFALSDVQDLKKAGIRDRDNKDLDQPTGPVPNLIGRVTVQHSTESVPDNDGETVKSLVIDDAQYIANKTNTDWNQYNMYKNLLREAEEED